jgi:hypothetical protein
VQLVDQPQLKVHQSLPSVNIGFSNVTKSSVQESTKQYSTTASKHKQEARHKLQILRSTSNTSYCFKKKKTDGQQLKTPLV